jgi:hypothetical protein
MKIQLSDRTRLFLVAFAVAMAVALIITLIVVFVPQRYTERIEPKWFRFGLVTLFAFVWVPLRLYWKLRKSPRFWLIFFAFLAIHIFGIGYLFYSYDGISTLAFMVFGAIEGCCLGLVIYLVLGVLPDVRRREDTSRWTPTL